MTPANINEPRSSPVIRRIGRAIDMLCLIALLCVIFTVIYGLILRARFEQSYGIAAVIAIFGALVLFIGLAQQAIATRDLATWQEMALWRLRALQIKAAGTLDHDGPPQEGEDMAAMNMQFTQTVSDILIKDMQHDPASGNKL